MMMTDCRWFSVGVWVAEECLEQPEEPEPLFKCDSPANAATVARIHNDLLARAQQAEAAVAAHKCCPGADPTCPCQDGDACHYVADGDSPAQPTPWQIVTTLRAELAEAKADAIERLRLFNIAKDQRDLALKREHRLAAQVAAVRALCGEVENRMMATVKPSEIIAALDGTEQDESAGDA